MSINPALQIRQNAEELKHYASELMSWQKEMKAKESELKHKKEPTSSLVPSKDAIPVRESPAVIPSKPSKDSGDGATQTKKPTTAKSERIPGSDYKAWDKFDVDEELQRMEQTKTKSTHSSSKSTPSATATSPAPLKLDSEEELKVLEQSLIEKEKGNAYFKKGEYAKAVACYSKSMKLDPTSATVPINRAMAYLKLKEWALAEKDCTRGLELEPKNVKALWRRGIALRELKKLDEAKTDLERASTLEPSNQSVKDELAKVNKALKERTAAPQQPRPTSKTEKPKSTESGKQPVKQESATPGVNASGGEGSRRRKRVEIVEIGDPAEYDRLDSQIARQGELLKEQKGVSATVVPSSTVAPSVSTLKESPVEPPRKKIEIVELEESKPVSKEIPTTVNEAKPMIESVWETAVATEKSTVTNASKANGRLSTTSKEKPAPLIETVTVTPPKCNGLDERNKPSHQQQKSKTVTETHQSVPEEIPTIRPKLSVQELSSKTQPETATKGHVRKRTSDILLNASASTATTRTQPISSLLNIVSETSEKVNDDKPVFAEKAPAKTPLIMVLEKEKDVMEKDVEEVKVSEVELGSKGGVVDDVVMVDATGVVAPTSMFEFEREWKSAKADGVKLYKLFRSIHPADYRKVFKNSLESHYLSKILEIMKLYYIVHETPQTILTTLKSLSQVQRFEMNLMFLSKQDNAALFALVSHLATEKTEVTELKKKWKIK
ncbi:hypothetical protein HDU76_013159 [Blyttiomyces sp. JEL0837]|nr:hypothetical protein HDU76_013159 [Blyttiomyces sp. JEL0837]